MSRGPGMTVTIAGITFDGCRHGSMPCCCAAILPPPAPVGSRREQRVSITLRAIPPSRMCGRPSGPRR
jgi:hypothetical protein